MADEFTIAVSVLVGLFAVGIAILERGYKRYLEEKKIAEQEGKTLVFNSLYMINMLVTTGVSAAFVAVLPTLLTTLSESAALTTVSILTNAATGYLLAYRLLDGLNSSTETKLEKAKLQKDTKGSADTSITAQDK